MKFSVEKSGDSFGMYVRGYSGSEGAENTPDGNMDLLLRFLDGQFADVLKKGLNRSELEKRTAGIMGANRRNYYGECVAYIAALGEVLESMGEMGAKQRLMTSYKDAYPRRNAFREEMRRYGWRDTRR